MVPILAFHISKFFLIKKISIFKDNQFENQFIVDLNDIMIKPRKVHEKYIEVFSQFAYCTIYSMACPEAIIIIAFLYNLIDLKANSYMYFHVYKRQRSEDASGIGEWSKILHALIYFSVVSNSLILVIVVGGSTDKALLFQGNYLWIFLIFEHFVLFVIYITNNFIRGRPKWVRQNIEKQNIEKIQHEKDNEDYLVKMKLKQIKSQFLCDKEYFKVDKKEKIFSTIANKLVEFHKNNSVNDN